MTTFALQNGRWTQTDSLEDHSTGLRVRADDPATSPEVQFCTNNRPFFHFTGRNPRPATDTTHTVALVDVDAETGSPVFSIHADGKDLTFEDCRTESTAAISDAALDHVQSALNEILIPVYIDDVVSDFSEEVSTWVALHTLQYEADGDSWSYFRTSLFDDGALQLEDEYGEI